MRDPLYLYGDEPYEENENVILIPKELVFTEAFAKLPGDAQILYFVMLEYLNDAEEKGWIDEEGKLAAKEKQSGYWKNWMNKRGWG